LVRIRAEWCRVRRKSWLRRETESTWRQTTRGQPWTALPTFLEKGARLGSPHFSAVVSGKIDVREESGLSANQVTRTIVFEGAGGRYEVPPEQWAEMLLFLEDRGGNLSTSGGHRI
jgi:hypothetical protein